MSLNKGTDWKPKGKLSDNSLNKTKQIWQPKGKLSDNSLNKTKQVWKATGKLFANIGYQWRPTGKKFTSGKLNCGYQWRPTGNKFALGELCLFQLGFRTCCSKLDLEEEMAPVRISSGPEPKMMFGQNSSSLVLHQMMSAQNSSGLAPQCLKMLEHSSSSLGLHCQKTFKQISSNLVSQMSQRRLLASLQAPFLKEKKGVRFSALYLQKKRNLFVLDHSHQQVSYFVHARSVVMWINVDQLVGSNSNKEPCALAGPNPEHMARFFIATNNPKERIEKTKRSKNDQKPTRNGKKTKSQEQDKESSQRSQPDQPDTVKLSQRKK
ncbi:hypothetical protein Tco_0880017 [Tanacetum coccineum]